MVFKNRSVLVLWLKVASKLDKLKIKKYLIKNVADWALIQDISFKFSLKDVLITTKSLFPYLSFMCWSKHELITIKYSIDHAI